MTEWYPYQPEGRTWLLGDGSILAEPPMERSGSNRRARIAGRQDTSVVWAERHVGMLQEVRRRAKRRGTYPWMAQLGNQPQMWAKGCSPDNSNTDLFAVSPLDLRNKSEKPTRVYWTFRHPTLPIEAQVVVTGETIHTTRHKVDAFLSVPDTRPNRLTAQHHKVEENNFQTYRDSIIDLIDGQAASKFDRARDVLPDYLTEVDLGSAFFTSERGAVKALLERIRWAESLETIKIPDLRTGKDDSELWVELELVETNMNGQLSADIQEYLTSGPTVDAALDAYTTFQNVLRSLGMVLPKVTENDMMRLLIAGEDATVTLGLMMPIDSDGELDHQHTLAVHLATGTFSVRCKVNPENTQEIGESWAEAQAIASITGKETELMAYARAFAQTNDERKTKRLVRARKAGIIKHD